MVQCVEKPNQDNYVLFVDLDQRKNQWQGANRPPLDRKIISDLNLLYLTRLRIWKMSSHLFVGGSSSVECQSTFLIWVQKEDGPEIWNLCCLSFLYLFRFSNLPGSCCTRFAGFHLEAPFQQLIHCLGNRQLLSIGAIYIYTASRTYDHICALHFEGRGLGS